MRRTLLGTSTAHLTPIATRSLFIHTTSLIPPHTHYHNTQSEILVLPNKLQSLHTPPIYSILVIVYWEMKLDPAISSILLLPLKLNGILLQIHFGFLSEDDTELHSIVALLHATQLFSNLQQILQTIIVWHNWFLLLTRSIQTRFFLAHPRWCLQRSKIFPKLVPYPRVYVVNHFAF